MALATALSYRERAQQILHDTAGTRYTDNMVLRAIEQGLSDMLRLRPDVFYKVNLPTSPGDATDMTFLPTQFGPALLDYILYYCEMTDQEVADESRAAIHYRNYMAKMTGGGS